MIWDNCGGVQQIKPINGRLYRMVESQEQIATLGYVDTLEEQTLLEEMIERVKPACQAVGRQYHYLLATPFRYPPLKWGSRFGRTHEPSIFYGGCSITATLAESAYYRFVFWSSMDGEPIKTKMQTEHTLFSVRYRTTKGISLHAAPFDKYQPELAHPKHYYTTQPLGTAMRGAGVEAFEYPSARDPQKGHCIGLFRPEAFAQKQPEKTSQWLCLLSANEASFKQVGSTTVNAYPLEDFLYKGELPLPG